MESGDSTTCRMMWRHTELDVRFFPGSEQHLLWYGNDTVLVSTLPYGNLNFHAAVIVPKEPFTSREVCAVLSPSNWQSWISSAHRASFELSMPRLKFDYGIRMNDVLNTMGMGVAFSGEADFSKMITTDDQLFLSAVEQKTSIQMDEIGTEAAATTWAAIADSADFTPVVANHPFIFAIYEQTSGTILSLGRIGRPEWAE